MWAVWAGHDHILVLLIDAGRRSERRRVATCEQLGREQNRCEDVDSRILWGKGSKFGTFVRRNTHFCPKRCMLGGKEPTICDVDLHQSYVNMHKLKTVFDHQRNQCPTKRLCTGYTRPSRHTNDTGDTLLPPMTCVTSSTAGAS